MRARRFLLWLVQLCRCSNDPAHGRDIGSCAKPGRHRSLLGNARPLVALTAITYGWHKASLLLCPGFGFLVCKGRIGSWLHRWGQQAQTRSLGQSSQSIKRHYDPSRDQRYHRLATNLVMQMRTHTTPAAMAKKK